MTTAIRTLLIVITIAITGSVFSWRLINQPSRLEVALYVIAFLTVPILKFPRLSIYLLLSIPCYIPFFRRLYYLAEERTNIDFLMLISDGIVGTFFLSMIMVFLNNKKTLKDPLVLAVIGYIFILFIKIFIGNQGSIESGFYGFRFNGLYILIFFAGYFLIEDDHDLRGFIRFGGWVLFIPALYSLIHIAFGPLYFEQLWLDSIKFVSIYIEGRVRPFSTFASPAALSDAMCILMIIGLHYTLFLPGERKTKGIIFLLFAIPPLLFATVRTNWAAALGSVALLFFFPRPNSKSKKWVTLGCLVMVVGFYGYFVRNERLNFEVSDSKNNQTITEIMILDRMGALANPLKEHSFLWRLQIWGEILQTSIYKPFGKGQGTTGYAHSYFFQILGEAGYPAFIFFILILFLLFKRTWEISQNGDSYNLRAHGRLMFTIFACITVLNLTGTHLHGPPGNLFFWFFAGVTANLYRQMKDENTVNSIEQSSSSRALPKFDKSRIKLKLSRILA